MSYQCYWVEAFPSLFLLLTPTALTSSAIGVIAPYQCYWSGVLLLHLLLLLPVLLGWWPTPYSYYSSFQCDWGGSFLISSAIGVVASSLFQFLLLPVLLGWLPPYPQCYWGGGLLLIPVAPPTSAIGRWPSQCYWGSGLLLIPTTLISCAIRW